MNRARESFLDLIFYDPLRGRDSRSLFSDPFLLCTSCRVFEHLIASICAFATLLRTLLHYRVVRMLFALIAAPLARLRARRANRVREGPHARDYASCGGTKSGAVLTGLKGF